MFFTPYFSDYLLSFPFIFFFSRLPITVSGPCKRTFLGHPSKGGPAKNKKIGYIFGSIQDCWASVVCTGFLHFFGTYLIHSLSLLLFIHLCLLFVSEYLLFTSANYFVTYTCHQNMNDMFSFMFPLSPLKSHRTDDIEIDTSFKWKH